MVTNQVGSNGTSKVLIIEDSPTQALHLKGLLERLGLEVILSIDGWLGLAKARDLQPQLIILDLEIPGLNGFQLCRKLKDQRQTAEIPVIMLTRHDDEETAVLGRQLGAIDYIPKGAFADAVLLETLKRLGMIEPGNKAV